MKMVMKSFPKVVKQDVLTLDAEIVKKPHDRGVHHRWAAEIIFAIFRGWMIFQILLEEDFMNKSLRTLPIVLGQGL